METRGGTLLAPHMDSSRMDEYFGRHRRVGGGEELEMTDRKGIPAEIQTGEDLERELAYGSHRSATKYRGKALRNTATNVHLGKSIVLPEAQANEIPGFASASNPRLNVQERGGDTEGGRA